MYELLFHPDAINALKTLEEDAGLARQHKAVIKALDFLKENPRYPGLNAHSMTGVSCPHGDVLFTAYAQNNTPAAMRIFFCYQPKAQPTKKSESTKHSKLKSSPESYISVPTILIVDITKHL